MSTINNIITPTTFFKSMTAIQVYRLAALLCLFILLNHAFLLITHLRDKDFQQAFLVFAVLQRLGLLWTSLLTVIISIGLYYGRFFIAWSTLQHGIALRNFILLLSTVLGCAFALQGYNFYFDQAYYLDRFLLLLAIVLIYWRPLFVFLFLLLLLPLIWQWNTPLGGYLWGTVLHVIQVLMVFCAWLILNAFNRHQQSSDFIFFTCCLTAAVYWSPGLIKFNMNWFEYDRVSYMPLSAYAHGWLSPLNSQQVVIYAKFIAQFENILHLSVLAFELTALICLARRQLLLGILIIASLFHCAVFAFYGYFMWAWIILDLGLILLLLRIGPKPQLFTVPLFLLSITLILSANSWLKPAKLAWYNTALSYTYRYLATAASGKVYQLSPRFFTPYGDIMTMANFRYLSQEPRLVGPYGVTQNPKIVKQLENAQSADAVFMLEKQQGHSHYNAAKAEKFYHFISSYISRYNKHLQADDLPFINNCCNTPAQFWSLSPTAAYSGEEAIKKLSILEITRFYDTVELKEIRQKLLKTIPIPMIKQTTTQ